MELRDIQNRNNKINMKLNKDLIITYLKENNISPSEFCRLNSINYTIFYRLMINEKIKNKNELYSAVKISLTTEIELLDLLQKDKQ